MGTGARKYAFFGGGGADEAAFYQQAFDLGVNAQDLLNLAMVSLVRTIKNDGNLSLVGASGAPWTDVDTSGTAAARNLDIVIPNVEAGDFVEVNLDCFVASAGGSCALDMRTIVAGAAVNHFGSSNVGIGWSGWLLSNNVPVTVGSRALYQLQAGDIEDGSVRCRLAFSLAATFTRTISATGGLALRLAGRGPFR
jgi:hypothetical protein